MKGAVSIVANVVIVNVNNMKLKIKVREIIAGCNPEFIPKGDWVDLRAAETVKFEAPHYPPRGRKAIFDSKIVKLGVAMKLPKGYEAVVLPRSGLFKSHPVMVRNSQGVIDNSYSGNNDEWGLPLIAFGDTTIDKGERVCQFRIQLSQKATMWQKIKWLFSSSVKIEWVDTLDGVNRGGFGSTGVR